MSGSDPSRPRKYQGRKKMPMEKIENENSRDVSFCKRRSGVFKKTSELCTLTGAEAAVVVFSPTQKPYTFATPDLNTIENRFIDHQYNGFPAYNHQPQFHGSASTNEYNNTESLLEAAINQRKEIDEGYAAETQDWFPPGGELNQQLFEHLSSTAQTADQYFDWRMQNANAGNAGPGFNVEDSSNHGTTNQGNNADI